jgi:hypothetical protein
MNQASAASRILPLFRTFAVFDTVLYLDLGHRCGDPFLAAQFSRRHSPAAAAKLPVSDIPESLE